MNGDRLAAATMDRYPEATPYFDSSDVTIYQADSREAWQTLPEHCADAIVTSPPYFGPSCPSWP